MAVAAAPADTIGGLRVVPSTPSGHAMVPALDDTGCRVPMLVWRCRDGALSLVYAFAMDVAPGEANQTGETPAPMGRAGERAAVGPRALAAHAHPS